MKKELYIILSLVIVLLSSCTTKEEVNTQNTNQNGEGIAIIDENTSWIATEGPSQNSWGQASNFNINE